MSYPETECDMLYSLVNQRITLVDGLVENLDSRKKLVWIFDLMHSILLKIRLKNFDCTIAKPNSSQQETLNQDTSNQVNTTKTATTVNNHRPLSDFMDRFNQANTSCNSPNTSQYFMVFIIFVLLLLLIGMMAVFIKKKYSNKCAFESSFVGKF